MKTCACGSRLHNKNKNGKCRCCANAARDAAAKAAKFYWSKPASRKSVQKERLCLVHGGPFKSAGPHNRICDHCKGSDIWRGGELGDHSRGYQVSLRGTLSFGAWH